MLIYVGSINLRPRPDTLNAYKNAVEATYFCLKTKACNMAGFHNQRRLVSNLNLFIYWIIVFLFDSKIKVRH